MNKRGGVVLGITFVLIMLLVGLGFMSAINESEEIDNLCKEEGYVEYIYKEPFNYCRDYNGDLRYIEHECDYGIEFMTLFPKDCSIRFIKVGEVSIAK